jgi:hypothetical protein
MEILKRRRGAVSAFSDGAITRRRIEALARQQYITVLGMATLSCHNSLSCGSHLVSFFAPLVQQGFWKFPRTWYEACFGMTILYVIIALFVFVTGYTPSRYHWYPVPRSAGRVFLYRAVVPLIVGCVAYAYGRRKGKPPS